MNRIEIIRDYKEHGTYSKINCISGDKVDLSVFAIELPWNDNKPNISCIPEGKYRAMKSIYYASKSKYECFELLNVPYRKNIKIHAGNYIWDTEGCILPAMSIDDINNDGIPDGKSSKKALDLIMEWFRGLDQDYIEIKIK